MAQAGPSKKCRRCKDRDATHAIRIEHVCSDCYCRFVVTKTVKRLEVLNRETRTDFGPRTGSRPRSGSTSGGGHTNSKAFLVGLSFGASSAALVDICEQLIVGKEAKGREAAFTVHVVHVDTCLGNEDSAEAEASAAAQKRLSQWQQRYPRFTFERLPLAAILDLAVVDWDLFSQLSGGDQKNERVTTARQLSDALAGLPSTTSRRDVLDLLVRQLLVARAAQGLGSGSPFDALLLGYSTTALAERTLADTAKGRGFSLPWQINDGPVPVPASMSTTTAATVNVYYPVRELFRKELVIYGTLTNPPLGDLILASGNSSSGTGPAVVSHKDLSIEDVMARYFSEVEESYPSVVANVVRTTAKLERHGLDHLEAEARGGGGDDDNNGACGICSMPLDDAGNERWRGEMGPDSNIINNKSGSASTDTPANTHYRGRPEGRRRICYGCERSLCG